VLLEYVKEQFDDIVKFVRVTDFSFSKLLFLKRQKRLNQDNSSKKQWSRTKHIYYNTIRPFQRQSLAVQSVLSTATSIIHLSGRLDRSMAFVSEGLR